MSFECYFVSAMQVSSSLKILVAVSAILGYVALAVYLFFFVGLADLISTLQKVNFSIYLLAIGCVVVSITLHALVWFKLLNYLGIKMRFTRTYVFYWLGIFIDNLVPGGWSGDLFKAYLLSKEPNIDNGKAVASVVAKNMYEAMFNLASAILGLVLLRFGYALEGTVFLAIGGILLLLTLPLILLMVISIKPGLAKKGIGFLIDGIAQLSGGRIKLARFKSPISRMLDDYHQGITILFNNPKMFGQPMVLSFFAWGLEIITLYLVFASLGYFITADKVIIVRSIAGNIESQGYAFAGYAQILTTALYTEFGVLPSLAASAALLGGFIIFWLKTSVAYLAFHCTVFARCTNYVCNKIMPKSSEISKNRCKKNN